MSDDARTRSPDIALDRRLPHLGDRGVEQRRQVPQTVAVVPAGRGRAERHYVRLVPDAGPVPEGDRRGLLGGGRGRGQHRGEPLLGQVAATGRGLASRALRIGGGRQPGADAPVSEGRDRARVPLAAGWLRRGLELSRNNLNRHKQGCLRDGCEHYDG